MSVTLGIDWSKVTPLPKLVPAGNYKFTLIGGKTGEKGNRLVVQTAIKGGEYEGKPFTFTYPDFTTPAGKWAIEPFKRLILALRDEPLEGETEEAFLNRTAGTVFGGRIKHRQYTPEGEIEPRTVADLVLDSVVEAVG